jgi:hypothetical protein
VLALAAILNPTQGPTACTFSPALAEPLRQLDSRPAVTLASDPGFAAAWGTAVNAGRMSSRQGDKVEKVEGDPILPVRMPLAIQSRLQ